VFAHKHAPMLAGHSAPCLRCLRALAYIRVPGISDGWGEAPMSNALVPPAPRNAEGSRAASKLSPAKQGETMALMARHVAEHKKRLDATEMSVATITPVRGWRWWHTFVFFLYIGVSNVFSIALGAFIVRSGQTPAHSTLAATPHTHASRPAAPPQPS
jgi:hypothetical protein